MKNYDLKNVFKASYWGISMMALMVTSAVMLTSCDEDDIIPTDATAGFTFVATELDVVFTNTSVDAEVYAWDFGDGSTPSTDTNPTHTYAEDGSYTVTLIATGELGSIPDTHTETVNVARNIVHPVALFDTEIEDLVVTITNNSTDAMSYAWDFGVEDDETDVSTEENPVYTYAESGTYTITLVATGEEGSNPSTVTAEVTVEANFAAFTYRTEQLYAKMWELGGYSDNDDSTYVWAWDFGDGQGTSDDDTPIYGYDAAGTYDVTLTLTLTKTADQSTTDFMYTGEVTVAELDPSFIGITNGTLDDYPDDKNKNNDVFERPLRWDNQSNDEFRAGGMSTDGYKDNGTDKTYSLKYYGVERGAYQEMWVEDGKSYTLSYVWAGDALDDGNGELADDMRITTRILNKGISSFDDYDADNILGEHVITAGECTGKDKYTAASFTFTASGNTALFFVFSNDGTNGSREIWQDNITLVQND
ncbi:MAG: PKD domain-containing protein [Reichenbachiella sp.]